MTYDFVHDQPVSPLSLLGEMTDGYVLINYGLGVASAIFHELLLELTCHVSLHWKKK